LYVLLCAGGVVLILEKVLTDDKRAPQSALMDDLVSATISCGRERTEEEFRCLLERNSLTHMQIKRCIGLNTFDVILARRPCEPVRNPLVTKDPTKI
jgi:hypothetical protein